MWVRGFVVTHACYMIGMFDAAYKTRFSFTIRLNNVLTLHTYTKHISNNECV